MNECVCVYVGVLVVFARRRYGDSTQVALARKGRWGGMQMDDAERLYRGYLRLAYNECSRLSAIANPASGLEREDLRAIAETALWEAACDYDGARARFSTYAVHRIRGALRHAARANGIVRIPDHRWRRGERAARVDSLDELQARGADWPADEPERMPDLDAIARLLPPQFRRWWAAELMHTLDGYTYREVAEQMGVSAVYVQRCCRALRRYLAQSVAPNELCGIFY